jgi:hypothetical protein
MTISMSTTFYWQIFLRRGNACVEDVEKDDHGASIVCIRKMVGEEGI